MTYLWTLLIWAAGHWATPPAIAQYQNQSSCEAVLKVWKADSIYNKGVCIKTLK